MQCHRCQVHNRDGALFCRECGTRLESVCPACGATLEPGSRFCEACGAALGKPAASSGGVSRFGISDPDPLQSFTPQHLAEKILASRSALEGERKRVTVLFCDIVGSTALAERLGEEPMHALINQFFVLTLAEVHRYEGTLSHFLGDGFMALFGAPVAHEDHARRAVLAALAIQRSIKALRAETGSSQPIELSIRIGLNSGLVVVGNIGDNLRMDYTAIGDTTNIAARLQQCAKPGAIYIGEATRHLVKGYFRFEKLQPLGLKGKTEPVRAYAVTGLGSRRGPLEGGEDRVLSRFLGRKHELDEMRDALERAKSGQGCVVGVLGEPGVGKSRLLYEFGRSLLGERATYLEGRCLSYGGAVPYLPLLDLIRQNCGIADSDRQDDIASKVRSGLREVGMDPQETAPYLLRLLGASEGAGAFSGVAIETIKARTFEVLRELSLRGSQRRPLILAVEDLHWIDRTSEEFLGSLVQRIGDAAILLLATYRPRYRPPWIDQIQCKEMVLQPLSSEDSLSMVQNILQSASALDEVVPLILGKAEGNAFFLEELTRAVIEHRQAGPTMTVPDSIQGVLMARIDRLPVEAKRVLQTASVLGREFSWPLLYEICAERDTLHAQLSTLKQFEFLYEQSRAEEASYAFKHALTQEVAYESLLHERRRVLHAQIVDAIERLYHDRLTERIEHLAHHALCGHVWEKAVIYLRQSGTKAAAHSANQEAIGWLDQALTALEHLPRCRATSETAIDIRLDLRNSLWPVGELTRLQNVLREAEALAESIGDRPRLARVLIYLTHCLWGVGDNEGAVAAGQRALGIATTRGDMGLEALANNYLGYAFHALGEQQRALEFVSRNVTGLRGEQIRERFGMYAPPAVFSRTWFALCCAELGQFDEGIARGQEAIDILETADSPYGLCIACWGLGHLYERKGDFESAIRLLERSAGLGRQWDLLLTYPSVASFLGSAYAFGGRLAEGIELLEEAVKRATSKGIRFNLSLIVTKLGEAYLFAGRYDEASEAAERGLDLAYKSKERGNEAWALHLLGEIAAHHSSRAALEAEEYYRRAVSLARELGMRPLSAHCHLGLGHVCVRAHDRTGAQEHLTTAAAMYRQMGMGFWLEHQTYAPTISSSSIG